MSDNVQRLLNDLKNPLKEIHRIREGIETDVIESFLLKENFVVKDVLTCLHIPPSTYFSKKKNHSPLDITTSEKFIRLISVFLLAAEILGKEEARDWLYRPIPSLGNEMPIHLLDLEAGHRLVEQALLQIKYGLYG